MIKGRRLVKMRKKGSTIDLWKKIKENPTKGYEEYFIEEEKYIKENSSKNKSFLDIGCGDGRTLIFASNFFKKVYGIDYDEKSINDCKGNIKDLTNVQVFLEDAIKMHFEDNSLDVVFIGLTFSNFGESKNKILKEIKRILKDDGLFIFSTYNENAFDERMNLYKKYIPKQIKIIDENKGKVSLNNNAISEQFSKEEIENMLDKAGFSIIEMKKGKIFYLIKTNKK
jgi:ubiquinone/menaquinone biosynthesis C-methylase UbiE